MRARNIKPSLFTNEILGVADPLYTLLFEGLWLLSDKEGRLEDRPLRIKAEIFPYRNIDVDPMLNWLQENDFIIRYTYGKNRYIEVLNFQKHQNPHKNEKPSIIPSYSIPCESSEKIGTSTEEIGSAPADTYNMIPDSGYLIPDSHNTDTPDSRFLLSLDDVNTKLRMGGLKPISQDELTSLIIKLQLRYADKQHWNKNQILGKAFEWIERQQNTPLAAPKQQPAYQTAAQRTASEMDRWKQAEQQILGTGEKDITPKKSFLIEGVGNA